MLTSTISFIHYCILSLQRQPGQTWPSRNKVRIETVLIKSIAQPLGFANQQRTQTPGSSFDISLIHPTMFFLFLFSSLLLLYCTHVHAESCIYKGVKDCKPSCNTGHTCGIRYADKPTCSPGQYLKEENLGCDAVTH